MTEGSELAFTRLVLAAQPIASGGNGATLEQWADFVEALVEAEAHQPAIVSAETHGSA